MPADPGQLSDPMLTDLILTQLPLKQFDWSPALPRHGLLHLSAFEKKKAQILHGVGTISSVVQLPQALLWKTGYLAMRVRMLSLYRCSGCAWPSSFVNSHRYAEEVLSALLQSYVWRQIGDTIPLLGLSQFDRGPTWSLSI